MDATFTFDRGIISNTFHYAPNSSYSDRAPQVSSFDLDFRNNVLPRTASAECKQPRIYSSNLGMRIANLNFPCLQLKDRSLFCGDAFIDGQWVSKNKQFDVYGLYSPGPGPSSFAILTLNRALIKRGLGQGVGLRSRGFPESRPQCGQGTAQLLRKYNGNRKGNTTEEME